MKVFILLALNLCFCVNAQNTDYYKLYKDDVKTLRPTVYLHTESTNLVNKLDNGDILFSIDGQLFKFYSKSHKKYEITSSEFEKINFNIVEELFDLEFKEYSKKALEIKSKKGFKPPPPIKHNILKVYVVCEIKNDFFKYEVDWVYTKF